MNYRFKTTTGARILYWSFVVVTLGISLELLRRNLPHYLPRDWSGAHELDALSDWNAAKLFKLGTNPFSAAGLAMFGTGQGQVGQAPPAGFWFVPMAEFPKAIVAELVSVSAMILLIPHFYLTVKTLRWPAPLSTAILLTSLVVSSTWAEYHFGVVQVSEHIAFLYVMAWLLLRQGKDARAGACIGAALTLKLFPGVLVIMLLFSRRIRACVAAGITYAIVAGTITLRYGVVAWKQFFEQEKPITEQWLGSLQNGSLSGLVTQTLFPFCGGEGAHPTRKGSIIATAISIVLIALAIWLSRKSFKRARESDFTAIDLPFATFSMLSVFLNPFAWEHYYMVVLQPMLIVMTMVWLTYRSVLRRWCDGHCSSSTLAACSALAAAWALGIAFVFRALSRDNWNIYRFRDNWSRLHLPEFHWLTHYWQVLNYAPWVVGIALAFTIAAYRNRLRVF